MFSNTYEFVMKTIINLFCYQEKVLILMNTCIAGADLMKLPFQIKNLFTVN